MTQDKRILGSKSKVPFNVKLYPDPDIGRGLTYVVMRRKADPFILAQHCQELVLQVPFVNLGIRVIVTSKAQQSQLQQLYQLVDKLGYSSYFILK